MYCTTSYISFTWGAARAFSVYYTIGNCFNKCRIILFSACKLKFTHNYIAVIIQFKSGDAHHHSHQKHDIDEFVYICIQCFPQKFWKGSHFSSGGGDHGLIAVFSPGYFGVVGGGGAGQAVKQGGGNVITLFSLCVHSSPLGKEVKQERNLRARKKKQKQKQ